MMNVLHLTASPFFGGPERGIMNLVRTQSAPQFDIKSITVSFSENGNCQPFMQELAKAGFDGRVLEHDMPHLVAAYRDLVRLLRDEKIDLLCANGHKARMLGYFAARRIGIPIIGVSRGWTWQDWKVSLYERIDQWMHRRMDKVIAVSQGQADKIIKTGTPKNRVVVIRNAIDISRFERQPDAAYRKQLESYFSWKPDVIVGAAGRLSPEKGYDVLIDAVKLLKDRPAKNKPAVVLFGEGFLRQKLQQRIDEAGIGDSFKMVGFTSELDNFLPHFDLFVQSSHTEGFPCVNVEAMAAGIPVLATAVGGVPEQIVNGETGMMVEPNHPQALADALQNLLADESLRRSMGMKGRQRAAAEFTCQKNAEQYAAVFRELTAR